MWQITEHAQAGRRALSLDDFDRDFLAICEAHRAQGRALAFAFIIFDARSPHLRKALDDDAYWQALDALSGRQITVFSFLAYLHERSPEAPQRVMRAMFAVPANLVANPQDRLTELFPGLARAKLPAILFFQVADREVVGSTTVSLNAEIEPASAYNEVAAILTAALESIAAVDDENASNAQEIFGLIKSAVEDHARTRKVRAIYNGVRKLPLAVIVRLAHGLV